MSHSDTTPRTLTADRLRAALHEVGGPARPDYLPDIVAQAGRTRQRPALTFLERWIPMDIAAPRQGVPRAVLVFAALALLLALLVAAVAFIGSRPARLALPAAATNGLIAIASGASIDVAEPDGSGRRTLVAGGDVKGTMAFSPDGSRLAYWSEPAAGGFQDLIVVESDGSAPVTIASDMLEETGIAPAWSPDGRMITFSARTPQADESTCPGNRAQNGDFCFSRIFLAAADGSGSHQAGDPNLDARSPAWSPDGKTIAFGGGNAMQGVGVHLYLMDADGSNVRRLSDVTGSDWAFVRVEWSHDGSKIAAQASDADNIRDWDIWIIPVDGAAPTNVGAYATGDEVLPTWAPDRDALVWNWDARALVIREEGAAPVELSREMGGTLPVWSPDGRFITGITDDGVVVLNLDGSIAQTIDGPASAVAWQPRFD